MEGKFHDSEIAGQQLQRPVTQSSILLRLAGENIQVLEHTSE